MLGLQEDLKGAEQFFLYLVNTEVFEQNQCSLEDLTAAISGS